MVAALLDAVRQEMAAYPDARVKTVRLRVGTLRQVVPEIMKFCFEAATRDTNLSGAQLEIEQIPAAARCQHCRVDFPIEDNWFQCPKCSGTDGVLLAGNELELASLELDRQSVSDSSPS